MSERQDQPNPPGLRLCVAIFLAVCFAVGMFNWLTAPRETVTVQPAEASTTTPWVYTVSGAVPASPAAGPEATAAASEAAAVTGTWVLNTSSMRFHLPDCSSVPTIKESNRSGFTGLRQELIDQGYRPCGVCKP